MLDRPRSVFLPDHRSHVLWGWSMDDGKGHILRPMNSGGPLARIQTPSRVFWRNGADTGESPAGARISGGVPGSVVHVAQPRAQGNYIRSDDPLFNGQQGNSWTMVVLFRLTEDQNDNNEKMLFTNYNDSGFDTTLQGDTNVDPVEKKDWHVFVYSQGAPAATQANLYFDGLQCGSANQTTSSAFYNAFVVRLDTSAGQGNRFELFLGLTATNRRGTFATIGGTDSANSYPSVGSNGDQFEGDFGGFAILDYAIPASEAEYFTPERVRARPRTNRFYFMPKGAAGQKVTLGLATETDTAQALGNIAKQKALGQPSETDTAQALATVAKQKALGFPTETDTAQALANIAKQKALGLATETDTALPVTAGAKIITLGLATETDTAQALANIAKQKALGFPTETDTALPITVAGAKIITLGLATETDTAQALANIAKQKALGFPTETDTAQALANIAKQKALGFPTETDTAQALANIAKQKALGQALEADLALPLVSGAPVPAAAATRRHIAPFFN